MTRSHAVSALLALAAAMPLAAQRTAPIDEILVTTATRTPQALDALSSVTLITRDDIERSQADRLGEVLRFVSGIDVVRSGGPGQLTSLFLRGSESNHTLVLVDGVRINPATIGVAAVQNIPASLIERVEIVTGPRSSLYGSDAIGGVINVITRDEGTGGEAYLRIGGDNAERAGANLGAEHGAWSFRAGVDSQRAGGLPTRSFTTDDRGFENRSASLSVSRALDNGQIGLQHWAADGTSEYADFFGLPVAQDFRNSVTALSWQQVVQPDWDSTLIVSHITDDIEQRDSPDYLRSERLSLDWQNTLNLGAGHALTAGIYVFEERAESLSFGSGFDEDTGLQAVFVQDQFRIGRVELLAALRLTDHEAFGSELTWNGAFAIDATDALRLQLSAGRAFRAPDATDRFGFGGNPALEPEVSDQWQAAAIWRPNSAWRWSLEFYANDIRDLIDFDLVTFTLRNIARAEIRGAELRGEWDRGDWRIRLSLVGQRADDADSGERLLRRSERSAILDVQRQWGDADVSLQVRADGPRRDFGGVELAGYALVNLGLGYALGEDWRVSLGIENLLDADYAPAADFRAQDRLTTVGLRYTW